MAVFNLYKLKLQRSMYEATGDPAAYDDIYEIIRKKNDAASVAFDVVIDDIKKRWKKKDSGLRRTRVATNTPPGSPPSQPSATGISSEMPPETLKCIGMLKVLHGIVLSFPFEMGQVFEEKTNGGKLLKLVYSQIVPVDIRMVLVSLASRWYACLGANRRAQENLAVIVDSFYSDTGLSPAVSFLPKAPSRIRHGVGVEYPPVDRHRPMASYMYLPKARVQAAGSARSVATDPADAFSGQRERDGNVGVQRQSFQIPRPLSPREQSQQQQQSMLQRRRSLQNTPPQQTIRSEAVDEKPKVTAEQLSRMITCAQELCSISNMIIDNLVALAIDDDPRTNPVIQDMMANMGHTHTVVANYISMLSADHTTETRKLKQAIDESKRCQWVYNDTARAFAVWMESKDEYKKGNNLAGVKAQAFADASPSGSCSTPKTNAGASGSNGVMMMGNHSQSFGSKPATGDAEKTPAAVQRMSTKVRDKMADTSAPSDNNNDNDNVNKQGLE